MMMPVKRFTEIPFFGIIASTVSKVAPITIQVIKPTTRLRKKEGNQRKPFVSYLRRLFVTGYSKFLRCYEWLNSQSLQQRKWQKC